MWTAVASPGEPGWFKGLALPGPRIAHQNVPNSSLQNRGVAKGLQFLAKVRIEHMLLRSG